MMKSSSHCQYPIACIALWIEPAVLLEQFLIFHDLGGNPTGYMTWAFLAEDPGARSNSSTCGHLKLLHLTSQQ